MPTEIATELEQRAANSINSERKAAGLDELTIELHLNSAAQSHSDWMAETGEFSHEGRGGSAAGDRIEAADLPLSGAWRATENLAYSTISGELDQDEIDTMHEGLMNSDGHRANILDPDVSYVGIGLSVGTQTIDGVDRDVVFLTQNFAETDGDVQVQQPDDDATDHQPDPDPDDPAEEDPTNDEQPSQDQLDEEEESGGGSSACFVATAAYGNPAHADVEALRLFRDRVLIRHPAGRLFIRAYWIVGPKLARWVSHDASSGHAARAVLAPLARLAGRWAQR